MAFYPDGMTLDTCDHSDLARRLGQVAIYGSTGIELIPTVGYGEWYLTLRVENKIDIFFL
jgi:hypothetical protein